MSIEKDLKHFEIHKVWYKYMNPGSVEVLSFKISLLQQIVLYSEWWTGVWGDPWFLSFINTSIHLSCLVHRTNDDVRPRVLYTICPCFSGIKWKKTMQKDWNACPAAIFPHFQNFQNFQNTRRRIFCFAFCVVFETKELHVSAFNF